MINPPQITDSLRALMAAIGPRWAEDTAGHVKLMIDRFTSLLAEAPKDGVSVKWDLSYGSHPRQCLDLFLPEENRTGRAALLFVHGGAFVEGDRNRTDEIYSNVPRYFARNGIVAANVEYRLAPEAQYPEGSRDVGGAVQWIRSHAAELGVDRDRIFIMGHSAGGAHVGSYAYDRRLHPGEDPGIAGAIIVSGRVRADNLPSNPNARRVETYYGTDSSRYDDCSAVSHAGADSVPTLIAMSEFENPLLDVYCTELAYRLAHAKGRAPRIVWMRGHNHISIVAHFNTAEDYLGRAICEFIERPQ